MGESDWIKLGHRALACARWPRRVPSRIPLGMPPYYRAEEDGSLWRLAEGEWIPDFRDGATLGVLQGVTRRAWGYPELRAEWRSVTCWAIMERNWGNARERLGAWRVMYDDTTEAGAWLAALEAVPHGR